MLLAGLSEILYIVMTPTCPLVLYKQNSAWNFDTAFLSLLDIIGLYEWLFTEQYSQST